MQLLGRLTFPISMLAFPFYLLNRSPGKEGSHYDPKADLFKENEGGMVRTISEVIRNERVITMLYCPNMHHSVLVL